MVNGSDQSSGRARVLARLSIQGLTGRWGDFVLEPAHLDVHAGEYLVLLGPSGCGKTTLMELLCGLRKPRAGRLCMDGADITRADPADRRIGYLPQDYELFSVRSAEWNIRFASRMKRRRDREVEDRFARVVDILNVGGLLHRDVTTLSGGERQRVALGRALMAEPQVLILDEPVSALPESLRDAICGELKRLHASLNLTTIHVSHNLDEALSVATRLAIMDQGRVVQTGTPAEILDKPANRFVAEFTQSRNIWPATARNGELRIDDQIVCRTQAQDGAYHLVIRPERLRLLPGPSAANGITGRVTESTRISHMVLTQVDLGPVQAWVRDESLRNPGDPVTVLIPEESVVLLPR